MSSLSFLIVVLSIFLLLQPISSLDLLGPIIDIFKEPICQPISCGKGTCVPAHNHTFGFRCDCQRGWKRSLSGDSDHYGFLPCVIPNCSILDSTCTKDETLEPEDEEPVSSDTSIFNPCHWAYCGEGTCVRHGIFGHSCECKPSALNLFRNINYPCFNKCSLGTNCPDLGLTPPPGVSDTALPALPTGHASSVPPGKMPWLVILASIRLNLWN